jgi:hypothetical protein
MTLDFINTFLQPSNRQYMEDFFKYDANEVVDSVFEHCKLHSNLHLDDFTG